jgi:phage tail-like protein
MTSATGQGAAALATTRAAGAADSSVVVASRFVIQVTLNLPGISSTSGTIAFSELTGITSEVEPSEYHSSSTTGVFLSKQFGRTKPATVTLKRGVDNNPLLWLWHQAVIDGNPNARASNCSLLLQDTTKEVKATYHLYNAWPSKVDIGGMKAGSSEVVYATATLVCDQIVFKPTVGSGS